MKKKQAQSYENALAQLVILKMQIDEMRPLYAQYDELLQHFLHAGLDTAQVKIKGVRWAIQVTDLFEKNTAWKSVAFRRYDIKIERRGKL